MASKTGLELRLDLIWGNPSKTTVYAQGYGYTRTVIFSFKPLQDQRRSLAARVVNCYYGRPVNNAKQTFATRKIMERAIWTSLQRVWRNCFASDSLKYADVVIEVDQSSESFDRGSEEDPPTWYPSLHPLFPTYFQVLKELSAGMERVAKDSEVRVIGFYDVTRLNNLGGDHYSAYSGTTKVNIKYHGKTPYVYQGADFGLALRHVEEGDQDAYDKLRQLLGIWYHSEAIVRKMDPHDNIAGKPVRYVRLQDPSRHKCEGQVICGVLYPYYSMGDVEVQIDNANKNSKKIDLQEKLLWCQQMTAAVEHAHTISDTWHGDIKPANFLINREGDLLLSGWDQFGAAASTIAPEADGTFDVAWGDSNGSDGTENCLLKYSKYEGPTRRKVGHDFSSRTWDRWNVFPVWHEMFPDAVELAEVFSLGRSMWMLLRQPNLAGLADLKHPTQLVTEWPEDCEVPRDWRDIVDRCMHLDPNKRPRLTELSHFWNSKISEVVYCNSDVLKSPRGHHISSLE